MADSSASPKRRRVLFVVESGTDSRLVEGLAGLFDLELLCRRITNGVEISQPLRVAVPVEVGPASRLGFSLWVVLRLRAKRRKCDLVVVQGYSLASLGCNLFGKCFKLATVMLVCSPVELYYRCRRYSRWLSIHYHTYEYLGIKILAWLNGRIGQQYFVLSKHLETVVRSHGSRRSVEVIPVYGVDCAVFKPTDRDRGAVRAELGLPSTGTLILFSSRIAPEKDVDALLRAVRLLRDEGRTIWLVNRSGGFEAFSARAREFGLENFVDVGDALDPRSSLADLYRASSICVQASREEGLGFSPLEALACGTPVVASAVGGLLETIIDGDTGWSYARGDAEGLACALREVLANPSEAVTRTSRGREMVLTRYERGRVFDSLSAAVERILDRKMKLEGRPEG